MQCFAALPDQTTISFCPQYAFQSIETEKKIQFSCPFWIYSHCLWSSLNVIKTMPKRQWSRSMWYTASFITVGASAQDWPPSLGWRQSLVATANWPTWRRSRHPCEFLTLQGGASPGAERACLLLWSRLSSKRWLWPCLLCGRQGCDDSLPWQMAGMCSCANKNFLLDHQKAFPLWGLDLAESYS